MTKRPVKLLPIWAAVSGVIILAGILLMAFLGFNTSPEKAKNKTIEVQYDILAEIAGGAVEDMETACKKVFSEKGLTVREVAVQKEVQSSNGSATGSGRLVFTFAPNANDTTLDAAKTAAMAAIKALNIEGGPDIFISVHANESRAMNEWIWRGALALAVGAIVVLVYMGIRFGIPAALTGATACVHDVCLTVAFFAITRIPVYAFAPLLFAGVAAVVSLLMWFVQCIKMRENFKDPAYAAMSADEAVEASSKTAMKYVLGIAIALAAALVISGGFATAGVRLFLLPVLIPVAVAVYSSLIFAPALHVPVKKAFDAKKAKKVKRYSGKAKAEKPQE